MSAFVLDSFALLARYWAEPGARRVEELIESPTDELWITVVNFGEVFYRIAREEDIESAEVALLWMEMLPVQVVDIDWSLARGAAAIKAGYALAYADCFAAALAQRLGAAVVTGDGEFRPLERDGVLAVEWLRQPRRMR